MLVVLWCLPACRHPASGYVQGMNDLVTPFLSVFLSEHLPGDMDCWTPEQLTEVGGPQVLANCVEFDCTLLPASTGRGLDFEFAARQSEQWCPRTAALAPV